MHIADIDQDAVATAVASSPSISGTVGDLGDPDTIERLFADVADNLGGLDVLVNNAGLAGPTASIEDYHPRAWDAVVAVNLTATFRITQRAIPLLKESGRASVIVMSSIAGRFGYPNRVAYSTTKWGLVGFTKTLALELGEFGITANSIHPGAVAGPRIDQVLAGRANCPATTWTPSGARPWPTSRCRGSSIPPTSARWRSFSPDRTEGRSPARRSRSMAIPRRRSDAAPQPRPHQRVTERRSLP